MAINPIWTVRNRQGHYLGNYRAKTAAQAIDRLIQEQALTSATFRKSMPMSIKREDLTAKVEE